MQLQQQTSVWPLESDAQDCLEPRPPSFTIRSSEDAVVLVPRVATLGEDMVAVRVSRREEQG